LAAYIGPKNDRTLGISTPCDNIEADDACAIARVKYGDMCKITIASPDRIYFRLPILGSMIVKNYYIL
jgi:hypothetical protein